MVGKKVFYKNLGHFLASTEWFTNQGLTEWRCLRERAPSLWNIREPRAPRAQDQHNTKTTRSNANNHSKDWIDHWRSIEDRQLKINQKDKCDVKSIAEEADLSSSSSSNWQGKNKTNEPIWYGTQDLQPEPDDPRSFIRKNSVQRKRWIWRTTWIETSY